MSDLRRQMPYSLSKRQLRSENMKQLNNNHECGAGQMVVYDVTM